MSGRFNTSASSSIFLIQPVSARPLPAARRANRTSQSDSPLCRPCLGVERVAANSDELDLHPEDLAGLSINKDRKTISIALGSLEQKQVHPQQTPRVYHVTLNAATLFTEQA
jgi:hypothetical protein